MSETLNRLRDFLRPPKFGNPAKDRIAGLQHNILIGLLIAAILAIAISLIFLNTSWYGYGIPLGTILLVVTALTWQHRGHIERAGWMLVGTMYTIFFFAFSQIGFTFASALILAVAISLAGLLLRTSRFILVAVVSIATLWILPNFVQVRLAASLNELVYTSVIIGLESILLIAASRTLERSLADLDRSAQNLMFTNKDLQSLTTTLEQRVTERTQALSQQALRLQAAAEVSRAISSILDLDELVHKAVALVAKRFDLRYAGLFLLDEDPRHVILCAGSGKTATLLSNSGYRLEINDETAIGWCINHKQAHVVTDEGTAELALPLIAQGQVIGAMALQSEQESAFTPEYITLMQTTVDQFANGIEKARLYGEIQQRAIELDRAKTVADAAKEDADQARLAAEEANRSLAAQMWQTAGQAALNEKMRGGQNIAVLAQNVIQFLCKYLKVASGAIYILENDLLKLTATYAYRAKSFEPQYQLGEDLVGQAALDQEITICQIPREYVINSLRQDKLLPQYWLFAPVTYNRQTSGVVVLESMLEFTAPQKHFMQQAAESVAIALLTAQARVHVDDLLVQTSQQAQELRAQEEELRATNEELEAQAESLRHARG